MDKIHFKDIVRLNHELYKKRLHYKINIDDEYTASILPMGECACEGREQNLFELIKRFYDELGYDVIMDEFLLTFHIYKKNL